MRIGDFVQLVVCLVSGTSPTTEPARTHKMLPDGPTKRSGGEGQTTPLLWLHGLQRGSRRPRARLRTLTGRRLVAESPAGLPR